MFRFGKTRRGLVAVGVLALLGTASQAGSIVYGASKGPAIGGYDAVGYFSDGAPKVGDARYTHGWNGATWRFTSEQHRDLFKADPERYAPQYGGYCAYAMANDGLSPGDATRWRIVEGKLYLNANAFAQTLWETNVPRRVLDANGHWPTKRQELEAAP